MGHSVRACCLALLAAGALAACDVRVGDEGGVSVGVARGKAADEWVRTYDLKPGGELDIVNVNGAIEVTGTEGGAVEVTVRRDAEGPSNEAARAALEQVEIVEEAAEGRVKVEVRRPSESARGWGRTRVGVTYDVRLPPGLTASFRTENAGIRLTETRGRLTATTANGPITGQALGGSLRASAINGSVQASFETLDGPVELSAVNGPVRLELPPDAKADITAAAVNGNVTVDEAFALSPSASEVPVRTPGVNRRAWRLNGGGPPIAAQTTNGAIRILARGSAEAAARTR